MTTYEFPAKVTAEGKIESPDAMLKTFSPNQQVRIILSTLGTQFFCTSVN